MAGHGDEGSDGASRHGHRRHPHDTTLVSEAEVARGNGLDDDSDLGQWVSRETVDAVGGDGDSGRHDREEESKFLVGDEGEDDRRTSNHEEGCSF